jgi:hypothetical protein
MWTYTLETEMTEDPIWMYATICFFSTMLGTGLLFAVIKWISRYDSKR